MLKDVPVDRTQSVTDLDKLPLLLTCWRWRYCAFGTLYGVVPGVAMSLAAGQWLSGFWLHMLGALAGASPFVLFAWVYAGRRYALYRATLHEHEGVVQHDGVLWRSETWVPIFRLQHIDVTQGPLDRRWGMATLSLYTAGAHQHVTRIEGLPVAQAHRLRADLLPRTWSEHD